MKKQSSKNSFPYPFFDRDLSWLSFNRRVLMEAERLPVPLMERLKFLAIYSSNLDEFYRVRMPALLALQRISHKEDEGGHSHATDAITEEVRAQLQNFGRALRQILRAMAERRIHVVYNESLPEPARSPAEEYFIHEVASFLQVIPVSAECDFFPENNKLYLAVTVAGKSESHHIVNIPSDCLPRFYRLLHNGTRYILFLDDIVKANLSRIFPDSTILSAHSFKITRDAELDLRDEFKGNLAKKIEKQLTQRDLGLATRFLHEPGMPQRTLELLTTRLGLATANFIEGGVYHNLKDLAALPLPDGDLHNEEWPQIRYQVNDASLLSAIVKKDILLHPPYHSYETIVRFFNEASLDRNVLAIYVTLYRVASDSRIANALISAARNGKKVIVFVELKARFDEANNIRWAKRMKAAGVKIIESLPGLKVHAKIALVERRDGKNTDAVGLFATGNFNERTARYYTDHVLLTAHRPMLQEVRKLFHFLKKRTKPGHAEKLHFHHLLVGQFNLQERFLELIDREIENQNKGIPAAITIKMNNLEDQVLISRLYDASRAGVKVSLIIRGISCLVPEVKGVSENITVRRIVDRYLEHGRIFIFHNAGDAQVYLGSADWMNRNIYRRIEVCFPLLDPAPRSEVIDLVEVQLQDNIQATRLDSQMTNIPLSPGTGTAVVRSQQQILRLLKQ